MATYQIKKVKRGYAIAYRDTRWNRWYYASRIGKDGNCTWHSDSLYARVFSEATAQEHADRLNRDGER